MNDNPVINIPDHEIIKQLGSGGMATVYLAIHQRLQREVALKIMRPEIASHQGFQNSFISEGRIVAKLEHPNIIKIHDINAQNGYFYMSSEVLRQGSLKTRIAEKKLTISSILNIILEIADALSYAHQQGYIHRDIKPANIMFRHDGSTVLTDFGIAKMQGTTGDMTQIGCIGVGTPFYMSPEQGKGDKDIDQRTDIYSLGIVFYEMLTGDKPYLGNNTVAILYQHEHTPIPILKGDNAIFQPILKKALAKDAKKRFATMDDFANALRQITLPDKKTTHKSNKMALAFGMGSLILSSLLGWYYFAGNKQPSQNPQLAISTIPPSTNINEEQQINTWISSHDKSQWLKAMQGLKKSAQTGDTGAMIWLGYSYETGRGVALDWNKAWNYYSDAIQHNSKHKKQVQRRQQQLERKANKILQTKNSSRKERKKAYQLIEAVANKAKSKNNAQLWLAYRYSQGDGVTQDKQQAEKWNKRYNGL